VVPRAGLDILGDRKIYCWSRKSNHDSSARSLKPLYRTVFFTKMTNKMQLYKIIYCSLTVLHVLSDIFAHHQEHLNCITASGIIHVSSSAAVRFLQKMTNKMQLCRIINCSLTTCFERYFRSSSGAS